MVLVLFFMIFGDQNLIIFDYLVLALWSLFILIFPTEA
jgi:hypothetical protein